MPIDNDDLKSKIKLLEAKEKLLAEQLQDVRDCKQGLLSILTETYEFQKPSPDGGKTPGEIVQQVNVPMDNITKEKMTPERMDEIHKCWMPEAERILNG